MSEVETYEFIASEELKQKLELALELMQESDPNASLGDVMEAALQAFIEHELGATSPIPEPPPAHLRTARTPRR